jgi:hypothetical protein
MTTGNKTKSKFYQNVLPLIISPHDRYSVKSLAPGTYSFRAKAVSLGGIGPYSEFHQFDIITPDKTVPKGWIMIVVFTVISVAFAGAISYYYKHKIAVLMMKQHGDKILLMKDIEPIDFQKVSTRLSRSLDELSDIMEFDE